MYKQFIDIVKAVALIFCVLTGNSQAAVASDFNKQLSVEEQTLYLNGQGPRRTAFLTVYDIGLYLSELGSDGAAIVQADHTMAIELIVRSRFASADRISEALMEGLYNSTDGNVASIGQDIKTFLGVFDKGVIKGDSYQFAYLPELGTRINKNGETQALIGGLEFKQALFGIWLSDKPVTTKLKGQLLGTHS